MNSTEHPEAEVVVELTGCPAEDAHAVFSALRTSFAGDRPADDVPHEVVAGRPTVWTATFDVSEQRATPGPTRLTAPVTVDLQGGYRAVAQLQDSLASAFVVEVVGMAAGDQEQETQLRLSNR
ncbi:hypothetical protein J7I98_38400 [Streptomyces sp. ISL-98]|uniref:hypothetical protein n=1 Tax=Streptomyces sp. ISL-98 TaxID=2819192 RepID=UPI001BEBC198|nr:hypothetical protein [Streptomyces sp. ISL-98]MBT2511557.1 hypothetical protein [Streptomyces sp. ISL-98]